MGGGGMCRCVGLRVDRRVDIRWVDKDGVGWIGG